MSRADRAPAVAGRTFPAVMVFDPRDWTTVIILALFGAAGSDRLLGGMAGVIGGFGVALLLRWMRIPPPDEDL